MSDARYPIYTTPHASFIMIRTNPLYFGSVADMEPIIGPPPRARKGADAELRLGQIPEVWHASGSGHPAPRLAQLSLPSLESLYEAVVRVSLSPASLTSGELYNLLPRPMAPETGHEIGSNPSLPSSRLGTRRIGLPRHEKHHSSLLRDEMSQ